MFFEIWWHLYIQRFKCFLKYHILSKYLQNNLFKFKSQIANITFLSRILFFNKFIYFILFYFWLCWVFIAACGLSLVAASRGYSSLWCAGFSLQWLLLLGAWALGAQASVVVACGLSSCGSRALERRLSSCGSQT